MYTKSQNPFSSLNILTIQIIHTNLYVLWVKGWKHKQIKDNFEHLKEKK